MTRSEEIEKTKELMKLIMEQKTKDHETYEFINRLEERIKKLQTLNLPKNKHELVQYLKDEANNGFWSHMHCTSGYQLPANTFPEVDAIGGAETAVAHGGYEQGDDYWVVIYFPEYDAYVRRDGWYASYDGGYLDGQIKLVEKKTKTVEVFE